MSSISWGPASLAHRYDMAAPRHVQSSSNGFLGIEEYSPILQDTILCSFFFFFGLGTIGRRPGKSFPGKSSPICLFNLVTFSLAT